MRKIIINGGKPLEGVIEIDGMKNAAMPIIFGCLLVDGDCYIDNLPDINDVKVCLRIIEGMGAEVERISPNCVRINTANVSGGTSEYELVSKILELQDRGAHNINLVTATPYSLFLARTLEKVKKVGTLGIIVIKITHLNTSWKLFCIPCKSVGGMKPF